VGYFQKNNAASSVVQKLRSLYQKKVLWV